MTPDPFMLRVLPARLRARLAQSPNARVIFENSGWLLVDRAIRLAVGLIVGAWVARHLGPAQYGELYFSLALIAFFQPFANLGLDGVVTRDISQNRAPPADILGSVFSARIASGTVSWLGAIVCIALLKPDDEIKALLVAIVGGGLIFQAADTIDLWFQGNSQIRRAVVPKITGYLVGSCAKLAALFLDYGIAVIAAAYLLDAFVTAVGAFVAYRRFPAPSRWRWNWPVLKRILQESWPFMLSGVGIIAYIRIDQILLERFLGPSELGVYGAALAISTLLPLVPMSLFSSLAPYVARKKKEGDAEYQATLGRIFAGFGILALALVLPVILLAGPIVSILFGDAYRASAPVLALHAVSNIFTFQGIAQSLWFVNEGAGRLHFAKTVFGLVLSIVGNLLVIPRFGALGAAAVTVGVQFAASIGANLLISPRIFKTQMKSLVPIHFILTVRRTS
jgi:O-antigen/teichoic acid export membrane protein